MLRQGTYENCETNPICESALFHFSHVQILNIAFITYSTSKIPHILLMVRIKVLLILYIITFKTLYLYPKTFASRINAIV